MTSIKDYLIAATIFCAASESESALMTAAIRGMMQSLDPYSAYLDPEQYRKMQERYHGHVPLDEPVISPAAMFDSTLLTTVENASP